MRTPKWFFGKRQRSVEDEREKFKEQAEKSHADLDARFASVNDLMEQTLDSLKEVRLIQDKSDEGPK